MIIFAFGRKGNALPGQWKLAWNGSKICASGIWPGRMGELGRKRCKSYIKGSPTAFDVLGFSGPLEQAFTCDVQLPYILFIFYLER